MNILFWNINKNDVTGLLAKCIEEHHIDIVVLAEAGGLDFPSALESLGGCYHLIRGYGGCDRIWMIANRRHFITSIRGQARYALYDATVDNERFILACAHLYDRRNSSSDARISAIQLMMSDIYSWMNENDCNNLVVIGDLNANPYDRELILPTSFNAVLFKDVMRRSDKGMFAGIEYPRLYNPTIHFLSEEGKMYGSYYRLASSEINPIWNCLDQALFSASLMDRVAGYRYLRSIGGHSLMADVRPDANISDHLPLLVSLSELGECDG